VDADVVRYRSVDLLCVRVVGEGYWAGFCEERAFGEGFGPFCGGAAEECAGGSDDWVACERKLGVCGEDVDGPSGVGGGVWVWRVDKDGFGVVEFFCDLLFLGLGESHCGWKVDDG